VKSRKIDFGDRPYSAHAQDHWLTMAGNPNFPDYLRVLFVAYGKHRANGHANLDRGELAYFLVRKDGTLPERRIVWRAVQTAIEYGYLVDTSKMLCLVVSSHDVQGGDGGTRDRCRRDHTRARKQNVRNDSGRFAANVRNDARRSETNVRNDCGPSETNVRNDCGPSVLRPSLSSLSPTQPQDRSA
jgi:hypothetical protein